MSAKLLLGLSVLALGAGGAIVFVGRTGANSAPAQFRPSDASLLDRAIRAHGGRANLQNVKSLRVTTKAASLGRKMSVTVHIVLPERYRHDISTGDGFVTHATDGESSWATLDGVTVPLEEAEVHRLREQAVHVKLSLLVGLENDPTIEVEEKDAQNGLAWLEVAFKKARHGPYRLGFDPHTSLLKRAEWSTPVRGQVRETAVTLELTDYREVSGIMVPFRAIYSTNGQVQADDVTESVEWNPEVSEKLFLAPTESSSPVIVERVLPKLHILQFSNPVLAIPEDAADLLVAFASEYSFVRNGPAFTVRRGKVIVAAGLPIAPEGVAAKTAPRESPGTPALTESPEEHVLSTVVTKSNETRLLAAEAALRAHAQTHALFADDCVRLVQWNEEITQVQLPVRKK